MKLLVTVMGCGIGKNFDISKLRFNRINIFTDQDIDGFYISANLLGMIFLYFRPLIAAGYVYKVFTPLYNIDDKDNPFVANKVEMVSLYHKKIIKNYKVTTSTGPLSKNEIKDFLIDTYEYRESLIRVSESCGKTDKFLLECILANFTLLGGTIDKLKDEKFRKALMKEVNKKFKEVTIDKDGNIRGVANGKYCIINISRRLLIKSENLVSVYKQYGYILSVKEKEFKPEILTIGEFLDSCTKYYAKIIHRFKGLRKVS